jgi:uncharacterized protein (TIGR00255 family)
MTGFGDARAATAAGAVGVEVRAVNNRHLKVTVRGPDPYPLLEGEVEKVVRRHVRRGTLLVHVRADRKAAAADAGLNTDLLAAYLRQVRTACDAAKLPELYAAHVFAGALALPGVAPEAGRAEPADDEWPAVEKALDEALRKLDGMRRDEGRAMAAELTLLHQHVRDQLDLIRAHLPAVTADYRTRILDRVRQAVADANVAVSADHLIREVALFADRTDVAEEITRLSAHLDQFAELVSKGDESAGRKLEFVVQEMGREANTLGSKAGDVTISRHVFEIKATLEKVRELVQNVE